MKNVLINYKLRDCREAMSLLPHVSINLILGLTLPTATQNRLKILINKVCCFLYHFQILLVMGLPTLTEHQVVLCFEVFFINLTSKMHTQDPGTLGLAINLLC